MLWYWCHHCTRSVHLKCPLLLQPCVLMTSLTAVVLVVLVVGLDASVGGLDHHKPVSQPSAHRLQVGAGTRGCSTETQQWTQAHASEHRITPVNTTTYWWTQEHTSEHKSTLVNTGSHKWTHQYLRESRQTAVDAVTLQVVYKRSQNHSHSVEI